MGCGIEQKQAVLCCVQVSRFISDGAICFARALVWTVLLGETNSFYMNFQAVPKPVLSVFPLSFLVASSDLGPNDLENEFLMNSLHLSQVCTCHFLTP